METIVDQNSDGKSLFNFLKSIGIPFSLIQKLVRKGKVTIDAATIKNNVSIKTGQVIEINGYEVRECVHERKDKAADLDLKIVYQDDNMLVIDKPSGLAVQGGNKVNMSVDDYAQSHGLKLTHRLDKDTSGLLILAKNIESSRKLCNAFKHGVINKTYVAIVHGKLPDESGAISAPIGKAMISGEEKMVVDEENGNEAITNYQVVKRLVDDLLLVELQPVTGKKHQLRVHCAHIGCPILGDKKYGIPDKGSRMFLHAKSIVIDKSVFGRIIRITSQTPECFIKMINT